MFTMQTATHLLPLRTNPKDYQRERGAGLLPKLLLHVMSRHTLPHVVSTPSSFEEMLEGFRVVYREYLKRGIRTPHFSGLHFSAYSLLPTTTQFLLWSTTKDIAGTISLVRDGALGLPMEQLYEDEISELRSSGCQLAEVSSFALHGFAFSHQHYSLCKFSKLRAMFSLFVAMYHHCKIAGSVTDLVIVVHPKHRSIYELLGFRQIAPVRLYDGANGKPALPLRAELKDIDSFVARFGLAGYIADKRALRSRYSLDPREGNLLISLLRRDGGIHSEDSEEEFPAVA